MRSLSSHLTFRSTDEWKSALMTLPENNFFELFRSIFGNIKTPFNKQRLLDDLFNLLSQDEIRKTIAAFIDEQDHKLIAAVALLDEPAPEDLETFFAGELSAAELHALILNLEERLILYRFRAPPDSSAYSGRAFPSDEVIIRLALNPVLEQVLVPFIANAGPLFLSFPDGYSSAEHSLKNAKGVFPAAVSSGFTDGRILAALFAYIYSKEDLLKAESGTGFKRTELGTGFKRTQFSGLRKKILDDGKKIFTGLDLELAVRTLLQLELFRCEGSSLVPCGERIADFSSLHPNERQEYWAAGVYLCMNEAADYNAPNGDFPEGGFSYRLRNQLQGIASFIHRFRSLIKNGRKYPEITLRRLAELLAREDGGTKNTGFRLWTSRFFGGKTGLPFESLLAVMEKTGLLEKTGSFWKAGRAAAGPAGSSGDAQPVIVMDTAFSFILYPEIAFTDALALAAFCSVKDRGKWSNVCFELTRESAVRGFDQGMAATAMVELLSRLSHNRLDANLDWTLKDWESRYAGVSLHQGVVLSLAEDRRYLADARLLASMILRTLAPGVYLLSCGDKTEAVRILRKAGVDIIAQPPSDPKIKTGWSAGARSFRNSFPHLANTGGETRPMPAPAAAGEITSMRTLAAAAASESLPGLSPISAEKPAGQEEAGSIKQKFRRVLETMQLTKPEREELEARIERRLVLSETQLEKTSLRYEKLEARGLDYPGKSAIAKQAIAAGSLLEVSWPGPGGGIKRVLGIPSALEKEEKESILVLKPSAGDVIRIPLGKISLLRRIKQSIFTG